MKPESRPSSEQGLASAVNLAGPLITSSPRQLRYPIELRGPVFAKLLQELERESVFPIGAGDFIRPARRAQPLPKVFNCGR